MKASIVWFSFYFNIKFIYISWCWSSCNLQNVISFFSLSLSLRDPRLIASLSKEKGLWEEWKRDEEELHEHQIHLYFLMLEFLWRSKMTRDRCHRERKINERLMKSVVNLSWHQLHVFLFFGTFIWCLWPKERFAKDIETRPQRVKIPQP